MKKFLSLVAIVFALNVNAQVFDGVPISGDLPTALAKFKAKGYVVQKTYTNSVLLKGKVGVSPVELYIFVTPKTKKVYKFTIYFDAQTTWYSLKSQYERYFEIFEKKYGAPDSKYDFFSSPYEEGDGYEMSAVQLEKATFSAFWLKRENLTISLSISKWKQVEIVYENDKNMDLAKKEREEIESNTF